MITPYNILRHELIGLEAEVTDAQDRKLKGLSGQVVAESKNTITLKKGNAAARTLPKEKVTFKLELPGKTVLEVEGRLLSGRPQERIKKKIRIKYVK
ncbi:MAG: ribonuclease P protein subunit [Candidatus Altiarchaeota archaeon]